MDQSVLDALDNYRLLMVKEGTELLKEVVGDEQRKLIRYNLVDMAHKINNKAQRTLAFRFIRKVGD